MADANAKALAEAALRARVYARMGLTIMSESKILYEKEIVRYETWAKDVPLDPFPLSWEKVGDFLHWRCAGLKTPNTASWPAWQSQILRGAVLLRGQREASEEMKKRLHDLQTAARQEFGHVSVAPPEAGSVKLTTMWEKLRPDPAKDLLEWSVMVCSIVAYALTLRPGEVAAGPKNEKKVTSTLGHLTFFPVSDERKHGALSLVIPVDKSDRRDKTRSNTTVYVPGCGGQMCPVALMKQYLTVHGLSLTLHSAQPIFAEMDASGKRCAPAKVFSQLAFNKALGVLCVRAGVPRHTGRAHRAGRRNDLVEAGSPAPVVKALGRWGSEQAAQSYARDRPGGQLAHCHHPQLTLGLGK